MNENKFSQKLKRELKQLDEPLPPSVAGRLRAARREVINNDKAVLPYSKQGRLLPAAFLTSATCVALLAVGVNRTNTLEPAEIDSPDDLVLLTSGDELDMLENVEFLLWLAEQDEADLG